MAKHRPCGTDSIGRQIRMAGVDPLLAFLAVTRVGDEPLRHWPDRRDVRDIALVALRVAQGPPAVGAAVVRRNVYGLIYSLRRASPGRIVPIFSAGLLVLAGRLPFRPPERCRLPLRFPSRLHNFLLKRRHSVLENSDLLGLPTTHPQQVINRAPERSPLLEERCNRKDLWVGSHAKSLRPTPPEPWCVRE